MFGYFQLVFESMASAVDAVGRWFAYASGKVTTDPLWTGGLVIVVGCFVMMMVLKKRASG